MLSDKDIRCLVLWRCLVMQASEIGGYTGLVAVKLNVKLLN